MKKILFVCALEKEGKQIADKLGMKEISKNLFENENERLLISGMGKQMTAVSLTEYLCNNEKPDLIINVGYAGSTNFQVGKWVNAIKAYNYEWEIPGEAKYVMYAGGSQNLICINDYLKNSNYEVETAECYSSESFVTETNIKESVLFDMELHSISLICDLNNIKLLSLKKVSDNLSLESYYNNIAIDEIFELVSCVKVVDEFVTNFY